MNLEDYLNVSSATAKLSDAHSISEVMDLHFNIFLFSCFSN